jgi:hypothetical protein
MGKSVVKATCSHLVNELCVLAVAAVLSGGIKVGERAHGVKAVTAHTKEKVSLSDFEGQKVILWFYPRASTGG